MALPELVSGRAFYCLPRLSNELACASSSLPHTNRKIVYFQLLTMTKKTPQPLQIWSTNMLLSKMHQVSFDGLLTLGGGTLSTIEWIRFCLRGAQKK